MSDAVDKRALRAIERRERGEAKRAERRARYQGQTNVASPNDRCCCCSAVIARIGVNVLFAVFALVILVFGVMAATGSVAGIFGAFPGVAIVAVSAVIFLTAVIGEYGARVDNKCLLLLYFMVILAGFAAFVGLGAATLFGHGTVEAQAAKAWCAFPESSERGQVQFNCCGFRCPSDRPAMGGCPGGERLNGTDAAVCSATADGQATCAIQPPPLSSSLPGCRTVAVSYLNDHLVPLFAVSFTFGFVLFAGMCVSGRLLCKSTGKGAARRREQGLAEAAHLNTAGRDDAGWIADVPRSSDAGAGVAAAGPRAAPVGVPSSSHHEVPVPGAV